MIGKTIGHYKVISKIGAGGMGEVFLAEDVRLERNAAIKFLPKELAADPDRRRRFLLEAKAASALNHPNVCIVYDVGEADNGLPFIAMELIEGETLDNLIKQSSLEIDRIIQIAMQVADALDAAHASKIVHRDIKPANISINSRGQVKVLDFGLAKKMTDLEPEPGATATMQQTQAGTVLGTPLYMSPEQALGKELDHRSDLFSLGVVIYRLLTGQLPFDGNNFTEIVDKVVHAQPPAIARLNYNVPADLEHVVLKCLQKSPNRRYQSAQDLVIDLRNLATDMARGKISSSQVFDPGQHTQIFSGPEQISVDDLADSDVVLNYASIDDHPLTDGKPGWVSQLHKNLSIRMEQLSGEKINIARLPEASVSESAEKELFEHVPEAKAMISVVSPPFLHSEICRRGVAEFWQGAENTGGQWVNDKSRLLKVLKTAISDQQVPQEINDIFSPLFGFEFFEVDPDTGRTREFDETFGPTLKQRFFERVYDLAYDTCQVLNVVKQVRSSENELLAENPHRHYVYLATTTTDVQNERDRIRRELLERGHIVMPDSPLPMLTNDVEATVKEYLDKCTIAIHLLGRHYGVTPEDSSESIPALQVRMTAGHESLQRLIWMPGTDGIPDERQNDFLTRVQEDPTLHDRAEVIEGNLNLLKQDLIRRLAPPEATPKELQEKSLDGPPKLYLICDAKDEAALEGLEDFLFDQGLEVRLPAFDGNDADAAELHQDSLLTCDAVLVYYGSASKAWVDIKLRELLKATGYGRETPIAVQGVYIAPPDDRRKERYRSHQATILRQAGEFEPTPELHALVSQIKEVCS